MTETEEVDPTAVRRREALLTGAVLGPTTLIVVVFFAQFVVNGRLDDPDLTSRVSTPIGASTFAGAAICLSALAGLVVTGGWRGVATMWGVVTIAALAAGGTALSPFATSSAAPLLAALAAATLAGAALIRPRPEREVASDESDRGPSRDHGRDRVR